MLIRAKAKPGELHVVKTDKILNVPFYFITMISSIRIVVYSMAKPNKTYRKMFKIKKDVLPTLAVTIWIVIGRNDNTITKTSN